MKKILKVFLTITVLILLNISVHAADKNEDGIIWLTDLKLTRGDDFYEGMALVKREIVRDRYLCGFIDTTGKLVAPLKYTDAKRFQNGYAVVESKKGYGLIDKTGKEVVKPEYINAVYSGEPGLALVEYEIKKENYRWSVIDFSGKTLTTEQYSSIGRFNSGRAKVELKARFGFIDSTGKEVVPCTYHAAGDFSEGLASVTKNGRTGYIDTDGNLVIPMIYDKGEPCTEGVIIAVKEGKTGCIDKNGKVLAEFKYDGIEPFKGDYTYVYVIDRSSGKEKKRIGLIDKTGKEVIPPLYDTLGNKFHDGLLTASQNNLYGYIDINNRVVIPFRYLEAQNFSQGRACVKKTKEKDDERAYGIIDTKGNSISGFIYNKCRHCTSFEETFNRENGNDYENCFAYIEAPYINHNFIDRDCKPIQSLIQKQGMHIGHFYEGYAKISKDGLWGITDFSGNIVMPVKYKGTIGNSNSEQFRNGYTPLYNNDARYPLQGYVKRPDKK